MESNSADAVAELYTEDCRIADPLMEVTGRDGLREACAQFLAAFRIEAMEINEVIEQLPHLAVRWSWSVTHQGEYLGVSASGRAFDTWNVMLLELRDGLICRDMSVWDAGELRRLEQAAADRAGAGA
jgi:predicted ester cyclase